MSNNKIKLICSDIDGTLLAYKASSIPKRNVLAIKKAVSKGIAFVLCSGRSFDSMNSLGRQLGLPADGYICTLGGSLVFRGESIVDSHSIDRLVALDLLHRAEAAGLLVHAFYKRQWYASHVDDWFESEAKACMVEGKVFVPEEFFKEHDLHKFLIIGESPQQLQAFAATLKDLSNDIAVSYSGPCFMEVNPAGVSKGTGITALCSLLGIKQDEVLAIGDFHNDIDMFKVSGFSAAVGNAPDEVKKMATIVVSDCDEGGLGEAIEKLVF